jgi:3-deoxy-manno-octulosonate cytidylyltransferase (CMP-KDO synthetase)
MDIQIQTQPELTTTFVPQAATQPVNRRLRGTIVIPARLASTRLARKLLLSETGKPLIQHTYEAAQKASRPAGVLVAADCEEIASVVRSFGGRVELTSPDCASGTDRVAEIARKLPDIDVLVNVQGDEPEISAASIDLAVELLERNPTAVMSTLATPIREKGKLHDPACVKVVFDQHGRALYFSRSPIPFARTWDDSLLAANPPHFHQHIGLYAYRRDFLLRLATLPRSPLEQLESLEQLRVLHHGHTLLVGTIDEPSIGIDTPEDYAQFVRRFARTNCG